MSKTLLAFAVLPAFLVGQNAPPASPSIAPLTVSGKLKYRAGETFGITKLVVVAARAGYDQATNTPSEWRQGGEGYGKRYASEFGTTFARQTFAFGLEAALHEDPRYFPSEEKGFGARLKSVLKQTLVTRTDSGRNRFAVGRVGSALGASFLANAWQPRSTDTTGELR